VKPSNKIAKALSHVKQRYHLKQPGWFLEKGCRMPFERFNFTFEREISNVFHLRLFIKKIIV
jgi:hypothetical protein